MKIAKGLMPFLLIILAVICLTGCSHVDKTDVQAVITNELDLLKNLDSDTTQKYVSYKELFPYATKEIKLSNEEKDYGEASLKNAILKAADSEEQATEKNTDSMEERYLLLDQLLSNNNYATVERECTVELCNKGSNDDKDEWEIIRSHSLENNLVGGLMTYLSDNNLLSPEETLTVYLNTLKTMNTEQMGNYLGIESLFNTSDTDKNSIATALVELFHSTFDFNISSCDEESYNAVIQTKITTFDSNAILTAYQNELDTYLSSADAVIDGSVKRYEKSMQLLLSKIKSNTATVQTAAVFHLTNDGVSWKLQDSNAAIGNAIFGTLSSTPVSEEANDTADSSEQN